MLVLSEFSLTYVPAKAIKGQEIAYFLADHPCVEVYEPMIDFIGLSRWTLYFDGSKTTDSAGVGIIIRSPEGSEVQFAHGLDFGCSNNQAEYEALIVGLEIMEELGAKNLKVVRDSQVVIKQLTGEYRCVSPNLYG